MFCLFFIVLSLQNIHITYTYYSIKLPINFICVLVQHECQSVVIDTFYLKLWTIFYIFLFKVTILSGVLKIFICISVRSRNIINCYKFILRHLIIYITFLLYLQFSSYLSNLFFDIDSKFLDNQINIKKADLI